MRRYTMTRDLIGTSALVSDQHHCYPLPSYCPGAPGRGGEAEYGWGPGEDGRELALALLHDVGVPPRMLALVASCYAASILAHFASGPWQTTAEALLAFTAGVAACYCQMSGEPGALPSDPPMAEGGI